MHNCENKLHACKRAALDDLFLPYTIDLSVFSQINNSDMVAQIGSFGINFYERCESV